MALSVSGFPEPSRSPASAEPSTDEGYKNLMNSPRLRSLFGKKHDSRAFKSDIEEGSPTTSPPSTPPIASQLPSFFEQTYMPPPEDYELPIHMPVPVETRALSKRPQPLPPIPIPIARRATASPVRIQPSLTRLDIGAISKQHPPHLPKPPPTVIIQEWSSKSAIDLPITHPSAHARPLPQLPPLAAESSKHVNAVAGPSRLPHTQSPTTKASSSSAGKHATTRARSHSRSRIQPQGKPVAMRYQALSVEPSEKSAAPVQSTTSSSASSASVSGASSSSAAAATTSPIRPLPTLPAPTPVSAILRTAPVAGPSRYIPPAPRIARPRTSPGLAQVGRSVFDASRPIDLNASVLAPSRPQHKPQMRVPASTSTSTKAAARPRREHSADSYLGTSAPPVPRIQTNRPVQRTMPSPVVGARPMPVKAATMDHIPRGAALPPKLTIQTAQRRSPVSPPSSGTGSASKSSSSSASASAISKIDTHSSVVQEDDTSELDVRAPLHSHPDYTLDDDDSIAKVHDSPVAESPLEVYIDDMDMTSFSRSPSPITYARPNSRGTVSDEDLDAPKTPTTRRQPRSYRNSYRRPQGVSPPLSRSPSPIFYARRKSLDRGDISPTVEKRRTQPRSFHYDPAGPMAPKLSPPNSRPVSPERRSRSRQRKGKKDKDKLTHSKSRSPRRKFRSTGSVPAPPTGAYEPVLDISLPKPKPQSISIPNSLRSRKRPGTSDSASTGSSQRHSGIGAAAGAGRLVNPFGSALPHRRVASAVSVAAAPPEGEFDPYAQGHGGSCGIGMLRAAEQSNSSGISSSSAGSRKGEGSKREGGKEKGKDKGKRRTQHEQRQRVNSTTAYEEFFSSLRRKEQKNQMKDDIALVDLGLRVDNEGGEEAVVLTSIQSNKDGPWGAAAAEGMDSTVPRLRGLKAKF